MINHNHTPASYVAAHSALLNSQIAASMVCAPLPSDNPMARSAPRALLLSPHPDDECLMGALPLRLKHELGWQIINVPVTLGSRQERRAERLQELANACHVLGFDLALPLLDNDKPQQITAILHHYRPQLVILPHAEDGHTTHQNAYHWGMKALADMPNDFSCLIAASEFWQPQTNSNLMIGLSDQDAALLLDGLCQHTGEISRNPYHLTFPSYLADNARRGVEIIGGEGAKKPDRLCYAMLYSLSRYVHGSTTTKDVPNSIIGGLEPLPTLFHDCPYST